MQKPLETINEFLLEINNRFLLLVSQEHHTCRFPLQDGRMGCVCVCVRGSAFQRRSEKTWTVNT